MGGKSGGQVTGYKYSTNFIMLIGNPIEKVLGINFDKRGWLTPLIDKMKNPLSVGIVEKPTLYGENEGGVVGQIHARYGTDNQQVVSFYKDYMDSKELPASAYPFQSYLAFKDFYVGNSGYMKEMLLWPKRIHVRNDGRGQWYDEKAEVGELKDYNYRDLGKEIPEEYTLYGTSSFVKDAKQLFYDARSSDISSSFSRVASERGPYQATATISGGLWNGSAGIPKDSECKASILFSSNIDGLILVRIEYKAEGSNYLFLPDPGMSVLSSKIESSISYYSGKKIIVTYLVDASSSSAIGGKSESSGVYDVGGSGRSTVAVHASINVYISKAVDFVKFINIDHPDINPIHKIREILTDDTAMNKPEISVNDVNFMKAADRIYDEGLGISWSTTEKSCMDAINELCYHIEAGIRVNRQTGLYEMVLFRDDWFEENEIHTIAESKIKSIQYEITNADEVINQVNVNYYNRANIKNSSFSISESGLIQTLGRVNAETLDFPYFMNMRNAEIVANWKLSSYLLVLLKAHLRLDGVKHVNGIVTI